MLSVRKSFGFSLVAANVSSIIQFGGSLVIARLLSPEEMGIYSVAAVIVGLTQLMRDFGVTGYLIHVDELRRSDLATAFGIMVIIAAVTAVILFLSSDSIASWYMEPTVGEVLRVLALNILISPLGSITLTIVRREMRFNELTRVSILAAFVTTVSAVTLCFMGAGPLGLAWGAVAGTLSTFLMSLRFRKADMPWRPSLRNSAKILSFGAASSAGVVFAHLNQSASDLMLGKLLGMTAVGLFDRATSLNRFVSSSLNKAIKPVLLPWLSETKRSGEEFSNPFRNFTARTTSVLWPAYATIALLAEPLMETLFGAQWLPSAELVPLICLASMIGSVYTFCGSLYVASGQPGIGARIELVLLVIKVVGILFFASYGLAVVVIVWPATALISALLHQRQLSRHFGVPLSIVIGSLSKSLFLAVLVGAGAWFSSLAASALPVFIETMIALFAGMVVWLIAGFAISNPLHQDLRWILEVAARRVLTRRS